ncbi:MAG: alpha-hydroxy-acid oxidizing protein [Proteobacteria bacterium]|nr:MAG: alpha-hydroxy-acid oxidizing protein [Pseudomonadota bacterium]
MAWSWLEKIDSAIARWQLERCHNLNDLRRAARIRMPSPMFHYLDGAADDEVSLKRSCSSFDDYELLPRYLSDISNIDPSTTIMGRPIDMPVLCSPTGMSRLFHHDGELAVARAAARANIVYSLSTVGTYSIEDVAAASAGTKWFQVYVFKDRTLVKEFVERCKAAEYHALCLTIDLAIPGNRERDLRSGMTIPPKFSIFGWFNFALHPLWSLSYLSSPPFTLANVEHRVSNGDDDVLTLVQYINGQFDRTITWDDAAQMAQDWGGPFVVKGVVTVHDALRAVEIGANAIMVSTHGGRQLDHTPAPIDMLSEIVAAVDGRAEVILDGGIRRGTDVLKALALGARAVSIGRGYLFGLGAGGEAGVDRALGLLKEEIVRDMALLGCRNIEEITAEYVRRRR